MKVIILKCPILICFLFWKVKKVTVDLMVNVKMAILSAKFVWTQINTSLKDLSLALKKTRSACLIFIFKPPAYLSYLKLEAIKNSK